MSLPPLHSVSYSHFYIRGDVTVHPSATIAPGVILQAESGGRMIIGAGVCVGMGAVLHVQQGTLEVKDSTIIGAGVLVLGQGTIGPKACIGSSTTVFNCSIDREQVIPPGALIGDISRQVALTPMPEDQANPIPDSPPDQPQAQTSAPEVQNGELAPQADSSSSKPSSSAVQVYGQTYLNQLLVTLLPHRQPLNNAPANDGQSSASDT